MGVSIVVIIGVVFFFMCICIGKVICVIFDNLQLVVVFGIDVDRVVCYVWILVGMLVVIFGILWVYFCFGVKWDMGMQMLLFIFVVIMFGGLGIVFGVFVGLFIVGIVVEVLILWILFDFKYVSVFVVFIVIFLVWLQGLFGCKERLG